MWYIFSSLADPAQFDAASYLDYAQGFNLTNRMPLFVKAKTSKVTRGEVHDMLSSHFEGSWFDTNLDGKTRKATLALKLNDSFFLV